MNAFPAFHPSAGVLHAIAYPLAEKGLRSTKCYTGHHAQHPGFVSLGMCDVGCNENNMAFTNTSELIISVDPQEELSKQLTALSSQVVHLQSEIMRRGQLSGQLHQQLQADLPSSYINGHVSQPDPMQAISLRTSSTQPRISQEDVSPADASGASPQSSPSGQDQASESPVEEDDQARQPGLLLPPGNCASQSLS